MSNDSQRQDAINNPYSKKSIDFVDIDLLRSIDRLLRRRKKRSHSSSSSFVFVYYTADNQYYVILCLTNKEEHIFK
jgi:hypothetical protein